MTAKYSQDSAQWWRHSDYEIRDGYIVPAPKARLIGYNPWTEYRATDGVSQARERGDRPGRCVYTHLLYIARLLSRYVNDQCLNPTGAAPPAEECAIILDFTRQHGPLGILHDRYLQITDHGGGSERRQAWVRQGGSWNLDTCIPFDAEAALDCVQYSAWGALDRVSFVELKERFFPTGIPHPLPNPKTREFFTTYVESAREFALCADRFEGAVELLIGINEDPSDLNRYLTGISTGLRFRDGQLVEERTYASLLAICADWFKRDHLAGLRLGSCEACGQIFVSNYERTRFCSQNCRWKDGKRRQRAQRKPNEGKISR